MLGTYKNPTNLELYINNAFKSYKNSIVNNFLGQVKDEQLQGESCKQYNFSFYLAIYLVTLVYQDVMKYPAKDWSYFVTKYKLNDLKKCLSCSGINLDTILKIFTLPNVGLTSGIESTEIEETFQIEPTDLTPVVVVTTTVDLSTILGVKQCTSNIQNTGSTIIPNEAFPIGGDRGGENIINDENRQN